jgi:hypothetical protein
MATPSQKSKIFFQHRSTAFIGIDIHGKKLIYAIKTLVVPEKLNNQQIIRVPDSGNE